MRVGKHVLSFYGKLKTHFYFSSAVWLQAEAVCG